MSAQGVVGESIETGIGQFMQVSVTPDEAPVLDLLVNGESIQFLVDTGASVSVIRREEIPNVSLSCNSMTTIGASGSPCIEAVTNPLSVVHNDIKIDHKFLSSTVCPVNLMGRDLLCRFGVKLDCSSEGISISCPALGLYNLSVSKGTPTDWFYSWDLADKDLSEKLYKMTPIDFTKAAVFRCTAHESPFTRDLTFEHFWFNGKNQDNINLGSIYTNSQFGAISLNLTEEQTLYHTKTGAVPHIPVGVKSGQWNDIGPWLNLVLQTNDWEQVSAETMFSPSMQTYSTPLNVNCMMTRTSTKTKTKQGLDTLMLLESTPEQLSPLLDQVPDSVWAKDKFDIGRIKNAKPVVVNPKSTYRPYRAQYPLSKDAEEGIAEVHASLVERGAIVECPDSPCNTPILPIRKASGAWRFVQDLRIVNEAVYVPTPVVPNVVTIMSQVPANSTYFSVCDLSNAYFSIPIHPDSQYWFAFTFKGKKWTWSVMPQGYAASPTLFTAALAINLESFVPPEGSVLISYVDDLLICSSSKQACERDTIALLQFLAENGHKVSKAKLQFVKQEVKYLGHVITPGGRSLGQERVSAILSMPRPSDKQQLMSLLGVAGYCRPWIPDYAEIIEPLSALIYGGKKLAMSDSLIWTTEALNALTILKQALTRSPCLGLPNHDKPFNLFVSEKEGFMSAVLTQAHGDKQRPVGYFSKRLDGVARGMVPCLRAVEAATVAVLVSADIVAMHPLTVHVPHAVHALISQARTAHLTPARLLHYQNVLLTMAHVTLKRCTVLNPANLLPTADDGEPHECMQLVDVMSKPRPDLIDTAYPNSDLILYVDGSAQRCKDTGVPLVSYAVCSDTSVIESARLPGHLSSQAAELFAVTRACILSKGKTVTVYTDSKYCFSVCHDFHAIWAHRGFLTSTGKPIAHHVLVKNLLAAIMLPKTIAVCKCQAHTRETDPISKGNAFADHAAKAAAVSPFSPVLQMVTLPAQLNPFSINDVSLLQTGADAREKAVWAKKCTLDAATGIWVGPSGLPAMPKSVFPYLAKISHGQDHASKTKMIDLVNKYWFAPGFTTYADRFCSKCVICMTHNIGRGLVVPTSAQPKADGPFEYLMIDFITLNPCQNYRYALVIVDMWSRWVECYPCRDESAKTVANILLRHIFPRWGMCSKLGSDNGSSFVNKVIQSLAQNLQFDLKTHCSYHPESAAPVERANQTLKGKLTKLMAETNLSWVQVLPLALMYMRGRTNATLGLSPYEILMGRPMRMTNMPFPQNKMTLMNIDDEMIKYCLALNNVLKSIYPRVKAALPDPKEGQLHDLEPGDWVVVKDLRRQYWYQPRWLGPFQVLLITPTAIKVAERDTWIHASHCRRFDRHPTASPH